MTRFVPLQLLLWLCHPDPQSRVWATLSTLGRDVITLLNRRVAPVESLWTLPGRRSPEEVFLGESVASAPLVLPHTGRLQSEPTCATPRGTQLCRS